MKYRTFFAATLAMVAVSAASVRAAVISIEAADNATVQTTGPRTGANGKAFFNIEGSALTTFVSYGVADFNYGLQSTVTGINSATLKFTQSNSAFTANGAVTISLDTKASPVNIQPGTSPLAYASPDPGTGTDVSDGDLSLLDFGGTFNFTQVSNGTVDSYSLGLTPVLTSALISRLNAGSDIRLVIGSGTASVAATWAGATNSTFAGPTLELDVTSVPEPTTAVLAILALFASGSLTRRR